MFRCNMLKSVCQLCECKCILFWGTLSDVVNDFYAPCFVERGIFILKPSTMCCTLYWKHILIYWQEKLLSLSLDMKQQVNKFINLLYEHNFVESQNVIVCLLNNITKNIYETICALFLKSVLHGCSL